MHQGQSRKTRNRKEDRELLQAIFFFTIVAIFISILVVKGMI